MQLVTGQPVYMDDLVPADCLIVKLLRSPHANAIVKSINTAVAKKVLGIEAIFTWEDVPQDARRYTQAGQTYPEASPYDRLLIDRHVRFVGDGTGIGLSASEGAFLHRCTFENWEIGAYGGLGSWVNATGCTFRGNDVGLWLDNRGDAMCSGSYYGDSVYEDNGTAVRIAAMPGTETLDFNNCVFRGNGVNVENAAGYAVDLSQIVTVEN